MSQYGFTTKADLDVIFGFDRMACGYFVTVTDFGEPDDEPEIVLMVDSLFSGLTGVKMVEEVERLEPPAELMDRQTGAIYDWEYLRARAMMNLPF